MIGCVLIWMKVEKSSITVIGCVLVWMGVFHHCDRMCSYLDGCAFLMSRSDVSAEISHHCDRMCSCLDESGKIFHHCDRMCSYLDGSLSSL